MTDVHISSFPELYDALQMFRGGRWVYRGVNDPDYQLVPKIGRLENLAAQEPRIFDMFVREMPSFTRVDLSDSWELLAIGQHHGLPTRLLDWTENPLVAAFFSCDDKYDRDGVIFAMNNPHAVKEFSGSPFDINGVMRFRPRHINQRIQTQRGLFTIHAEPTVPLRIGKVNGITTQRIVVDKGYKSYLIWDLAKFGITKASLFGDLDGLSAYITWLFSTYDPTKAPK